MSGAAAQRWPGCSRSRWSRCRWSACSTAGSPPSAGRCSTLRRAGRIQARQRGGRSARRVLPYARQGFFAVRLGSCAAAVAALPWVERAEARKRWPDMLEVRIARAPAVRALGRRRLLSQQGQLFTVPDAEAAGGPAAARRARRSRVADVVAIYNESRASCSRRRGLARAVAALDHARQLVVDAVQRQRGDRDRPQRGAPAPDPLPRLLPQLLSQKQLAAAARRSALHQWFCAAAGRRPRRRATPCPQPQSQREVHEPQRRKGPHRRPRHRHLEGGGDRRRIRAGRAGRGDRHRLARIARPQARRGRRHRIDRAVDPARGRGSRADGRLRDPLGVRVDFRQPHAVRATRTAPRRSATAR